MPEVRRSRSWISDEEMVQGEMMRETIIIQIKTGERWYDHQRIEDEDIKALRLTPQQVLEYVRDHPSPLAKLFILPRQMRVLYQITEIVGQF